MLEQTREVARKFNHIYGQTFPEPRALLGDFPRLTGLDGNAKMSKSLGNAIYIADEPVIIEKKIKAAKTDPQKIHKNDPGRPQICPVFGYQQIFNAVEAKNIAKECRSGRLGCVDCKRCLAEKMIAYLAPLQERRRAYASDMPKVRDIVRDGTSKANQRARQTMEQVREKMKIDY
jgi:tryptophanyl-tRNA synthetase